MGREELKCVKELPVQHRRACGYFKQYQEPVILTGDGSVSYRNIIEEKLNNKAYFTPNKFNNLNAATLCFIAAVWQKKGRQ